MMLSRPKPQDDRPSDQQYLRLATLLKTVVENETHNHQKIFMMNFGRGIFFGLGAALGGTFVLAVVVWLLSLFTELPWIGDFVRTIQQSIDK